MSAFRQTAAVAALNLRSIPTRLASSLVIIIGIAGVVAVLISVLAIAQGIRKAGAATGRDDRAVVMANGAGAESASSLSREAVNAIVGAPEVSRTASGEAVASAEPVIIVDVPLKNSGTGANVALRGVGTFNGVLKPAFRIVAGRPFRPGLHELVVGRGAQVQFRGLDIGDEIDLRNTRWHVVGTFSSDDDAHESEMMADAATVLDAYRKTTVQSVTVLLGSADAFDRFRSSLTANRSLSVDVQRERDYFAAQSNNAVTIIRVLAFAVGSIMGLGAFFAALNTMYTVVGARTVEIATLRAIGFGGGAVLASVLIEAMALAFIGAALGTLLAWTVFQGDNISALNPGSFTQLVFHLSITPLVVAQGVILALAIGFVGGLLPALRAARLPVAVGLRSTV